MVSSSQSPSMPDVKITVVIPTHQRSDLLMQRALPSALNQTFPEYEVIVVLDGPDAQTQAALDAVQHERLRVIVLPESRGANTARNTGVQAARGQWIALLDDDDEWLPHKLADQYAAAQGSRHAAPVVVSRWITRTPGRDYPDPSRLPEPQEKLGDYMLARRKWSDSPNGLVSTVLMIPRELLLQVPLDETLSKHQDWDWLLRASGRTDFHLEFTERVGAIWYYAEGRPALSTRHNWERSLVWARGHWQAGRLSDAAYRGFLITHVATAARRTGTGQWAAWSLLRDLLLARARPLDLARFLSVWVAPAELRAAVREKLARPAPRVVSTGQASPLADALAVTLIDPLDSGHHAGYAQLVAGGLVQRGQQVSLVGPPGLLQAVQQELPGVPGHALELHPAGLSAYYRLGRLQREWQNLKFMRRALRLARADGAGVIHWLYLDGFLLSLLGALWSLPVAGRQRATLHQVYFAPPFRQFTWRSALFYRVLLLGLRARGIRIFVHDELLARSLGTAGFQAVDVLPYSVSTPALPEPNPAQARTQWRSRLGFKTGEVVLLAFGGTRHDKGVDIAIRALAELPDQFRLLVVGPTRQFDAQALHDLARQYGVQDRLTWRLEFIPDQEVQAQFLASDIVVLPYRPGFAGQSGPLTIAASMGLPLVASEVGVLASMVRKYRLGECFPAGDHLAMAQAVRQVTAHAPSPETAQFQADHQPEQFITLLLRSYARKR